jgi:hypothetical protein
MAPTSFLNWSREGVKNFGIAMLRLLFFSHDE